MGLKDCFSEVFDHSTTNQRGKEGEQNVWNGRYVIQSEPYALRLFTHRNKLCHELNRVRDEHEKRDLNHHSPSGAESSFILWSLLHGRFDTWIGLVMAGH